MAGQVVIRYRDALACYMSAEYRMESYLPAWVSILRIIELVLEVLEDKAIRDRRGENDSVPSMRQEDPYLWLPRYLN